MFELPGFDPKTMSDEQLMVRGQELSAKIVFASRYAGNGGLDMLLLMAEAIDAERRERSFMHNLKRSGGAANEAIETDPDLRAAAIPRDKDGNPIGEAKPTRANRHTGMRRPTPTAAPRASDDAAPLPSRMPTSAPTPTPTAQDDEPASPSPQDKTP